MTMEYALILIKPDGVKKSLTGNVLTMPGLPRVPAANKIQIDDNGKIEGLF